MQSVLQLVFSTSMLTILMSSNGLSFLSVLAFSIVMTTSLPLVTYKQRNTYIVPIHVLNTRYLQHMICNVPCSSRECQEQHNSSKRVKEGHTWQRLVPKTGSRHTLPKTVCLLSSQGVGTVVMKNWLPLVLGPALAILRVKGRSCRKLRSNSSWNSVPQMDVPPVPSPAYTQAWSVELREGP